MLLMEFEDGVLPAEVAAHLEQCSACRTQHARMTAVRQLMSLKRHEQPDNVTEARIRSGVRRRIERLDDPQGDEARVSAWELLTLEPLPALRYAVVALLVGFAAFVLFTRDATTTARTDGVPEASPVAPAPRQLAAEPSAPTSLPAAAVVAIAAPSNAGAGRLDYGPLPSVPVRLDY